MKDEYEKFFILKTIIFKKKSRLYNDALKNRERMQLKVIIFIVRVRLR